MNYKAVFFDFDYTIGDATESIMAGYTHGLTVMGHPAPTLERVRQSVGYTLEDGYTFLTGDADPGRRTQFRAHFSEIAKPMQLAGTPLCTGAKELIVALHGCGVAVSVVSSKQTDTLTKVLAQHGLPSLLTDIIGGDIVARPKPDPEGLLRATANVGLPPEQVLFCGDTVIDAGAAQNAGLDFCAVLNGTTPAEDFAPFPHVHIAPDLPELKAWLGLSN